MKQPIILFFDIETLPLKSFIWQPGTQYVGHKNLLPSHAMWGLICIQYAVDDGPVKVLRYDKHGDTVGMINTGTEKKDWTAHAGVISDVDVGPWNDSVNCGSKNSSTASAAVVRTVNESRDHSSDPNEEDSEISRPVVAASSTAETRKTTAGRVSVGSTSKDTVGKLIPPSFYCSVIVL